MSCTPLTFTLQLIGLVLILWAAVLLALAVLDRILITKLGQSYMARYGVRAHKALLQRPFPGVRAWLRLGDTH
ncbi:MULTISPECIES: hypothetical protein [unclassified Pseudomonas]|uniref:hypothetical protein n=1 Tax=unclassified Pseudomonas TaxID=196821 RepID=UPI00131AD58F|nr:MULTISPECIES: hypothetical protein [unclassified Pseudomonas]